MQTSDITGSPKTTLSFKHGFLLFSRMEVIDQSLLLITVRCKWCSLVFDVCRSCWHGQCYCCDGCRDAAQSASHRNAQARYRLTVKGKEAHRQAERRRRLRQSKKTMDDAGTTPPAGYVTQAPKIVRSRCHFCGRPGFAVDHFPRRGYGRAALQRPGLYGARYDTKRTHCPPPCQKT